MFSTYHLKFCICFLLCVFFINVCLSQENERTQEMSNVFFHFVHPIIDENTYNEIKKSDFLKNEFCNGQEKTHSSANLSWTGFYLTGINTYIQIFNNKDKQNLQKLGCGSVGINFLVDKKEDLDKLTELFKQKYSAPIKTGLFEKKVDGALIPWIHSIDNELSDFDSSIMAYHKDYLKYKNVEFSEKTGITREQYNKTCNAVPYDKTKLFKDIEEITALLSDDVMSKFLEQLTLLGYAINKEGDCTVCRGPGIIFNLKKSIDQSCKLLKLGMSLNRSVSVQQVYNLGNSKLELEKDKATWMFN